MRSLTQFIQFMHSVESPMSVGDLLDIVSTSQNQCIFIKNEQSNYSYANENFIRLMGLQNLGQLRHLSDYDLCKNYKEANKYREHDRYILEEEKILQVCEEIYPHHNQPIIKTMKGKLYPLFAESECANYVLGVVVPESKLLKLDFDTLFKLNQNELDDLLVKRSYTVNTSTGSIKLSKMEIRTLVPLLRGFHAGEIAKELQIKQTTVESYLINIKNKLAVNNKSELINLILNEKLLQQVML